jgi:hypothetical protein
VGEPFDCLSLSDWGAKKKEKFFSFLFFFTFSLLTKAQALDDWTGQTG